MRLLRPRLRGQEETGTYLGGGGAVLQGLRHVLPARDATGGDHRLIGGLLRVCQQLGERVCAALLRGGEYRAPVATGLLALQHDGVTIRGREMVDLLRGRGIKHHQLLLGVQGVHDLLGRVAEGKRHDLGSRGECDLHLLLIVIIGVARGVRKRSWHSRVGAQLFPITLPTMQLRGGEARVGGWGEDIDPEGLGSEFLYGCKVFAESIGGEVARGRHAEPTGIGYGGNELRGGRATSHWGKDDRTLQGEHGGLLRVWGMVVVRVGPNYGFCRVCGRFSGV